MRWIRRGRRGASGFQYALALGLIGVVVIVVTTDVGEEIKRIFNSLFGEVEEVPVADGADITGPVIAFSNPAIVDGGSVGVQTGTPFRAEYPAAEAVDLSNIPFTVSDDTTPGADIPVTAQLVLSPDMVNSGIGTPPVVTVLAGEGGQRALSIAPFDQSADVSGEMIVTLQAADALGHVTDMEFRLVLSGFLVTAYHQIYETYPGTNYDNSVEVSTFGGDPLIELYMVQTVTVATFSGNPLIEIAP
jgi:Flp pilus assembly pilin Flp